MARRSDHNRQQLYEMAVAAARELAVKGGLKAVTARNIADQIGYSPGTLYNVFSDLDDLIIHLNGQTIDEIHQQLASADRTGHPIDVLQSILQKYLNYLEHHRNLWNILFEHRLPEDRPLPDWYLGKLASLLSIVEQALAPIFPPGEQDKLSAATRVLWASVQGITSLFESGKLQIISNETIQEMSEMLIVCFVTGLEQTQRKQSASTDPAGSPG